MCARRIPIWLFRRGGYHPPAAPVLSPSVGAGPRPAAGVYPETVIGGCFAPGRVTFCADRKSPKNRQRGGGFRIVPTPFVSLRSTFPPDRGNRPHRPAGRWGHRPLRIYGTRAARRVAAGLARGSHNSQLSIPFCILHFHASHSDLCSSHHAGNAGSLGERVGVRWLISVNSVFPSS